MTVKHYSLILLLGVYWLSRVGFFMVNQYHPSIKIFLMWIMEPALAEKMKEKERKHIKNIPWQSLSSEQEWSQEPPGTQSAESIQMGPVLHRRSPQPCIPPGPRGNKEAFVGALHMVVLLLSKRQLQTPQLQLWALPLAYSPSPVSYPQYHNRYITVVLKLLNFNCILMILVYIRCFHCCICK